MPLFTLRKGKQFCVHFKPTFPGFFLASTLKTYCIGDLLYRLVGVGGIMPSALRLGAERLQIDASGLCWKKIHSKLSKETERGPSMRKCQNWAAFAFVVVKIDSIQISANENVHL